MRGNDRASAANSRLSCILQLNWRVWSILGGYSLAQFGAGLFTPFLMVYLHNARHFPASLVGLVLSVLETCPAWH